MAYLPPPPDAVDDYWKGWADSQIRIHGQINPVLQAGIASFGLNYIHPVEDGNGRVSRYLIHAVYANTGFTQPGVLFPVSGVILKTLADYERVLNLLSTVVMQNAEYDFHDDLPRIENPEVLHGFWRYPDLTEQCTYLGRSTQQCLDVVMNDNLRYLDWFERSKLSIREHLDLPDRHLDALVAGIHAGGGRLSRNKRTSKFFSALSDEEIHRAEADCADARETPRESNNNSASAKRSEPSMGL